MRTAATIFAAAGVMLMVGSARANDIASSTMYFRGTLADDGAGGLSGVLRMLDEDAENIGDDVAGYDIYGDEGSDAWFGNDSGSGPVWTSQAIGSDHDAWPTWTPDTPDWYQYSLNLYVDGGSQKWAVRNHAGATEAHPWYDTTYWGSEKPACGVPMSGSMDWASMYAAETDVGAYLPGTGTPEIPNGAAGQGGGAGAWDMDWSWGSEVVPLELPGFSVAVTDLGGGEYEVTLTPSAGPVQNLNTGNSYMTIQAAIDAASPADVITVAAGTYNERITINKSLELRGAQYGVDPTPSGSRTDTSAESIITEAGLSTPNPDVLVEIPSGVTNVIINGFTLNGDPTNTTADTCVIRSWGNDVTVSKNIMDGMAGVLLKGGDGLAVSANRLTTNATSIIVQPNPASNVTISGNMCGPGISPVADAKGIYMTGVTGAMITGNAIIGYPWDGVAGSSLTNVDVSGNSVTGCRKAVSFWGNTTFVTIAGNDLLSSTIRGIEIKGQDITIENNRISGSGDAGVYIGKHTLTTERVTISENDLSGNAGGGLVVDTATVTETVDASANWWGSTVAAAVAASVSDGADYTPWLAGGTSLNPGFNGDFSTLYVDDDSPQTGSSTRIQEAADLVAGSTVNVAAGTYAADPTTGKGVHITKDGVNLIGEAAASTIIDGSIGGVGGSGAYWPMGIQVEANNVTVQSFTVEGFTGDGVNTGGYGVLFRDYAHDTPGEGYVFYDGCTVQDVIVQDCYSSIYALCFTHLTVTGCAVQDSLADGMFIARGCDDAVVSNNVVTNSGDHGIWVGYCWMALEPSDRATITNNKVDGAEEGGISFVASDTATISDNTITNVAGAGWSVGALSLKDGASNVEAYGNRIYGNDGSWGGYSGTGHAIGIDGSPSNINLHHNSIYGNTGAGCYNYSSTVVLAEDNWWGDASGPHDPNGTDETDGVTCYTPSTMKNADGTGDEVSDANVDYCPWLTSDPTVNILKLDVQGNPAYLKPGDSVVIDMDALNLAQHVIGCQAVLNFSSTYFLAGSGEVGVGAGGGVWSELIYSMWDTAGDLDVAVGVELTSPVGTKADGTVAIFTLNVDPSAPDGTTQMVFRPDVDDIEGTFFSDLNAQAVYPGSKIDSQTIVIDGTPPVITCPVNVVVSTDTGVCEATNVDIGMPTTTDDNPVSVTNDHPSTTYPKGTTVVTWTATDAAGNTATCTQNVTVNDTEDPTITCPADVVVDTDVGVCYATGVALGTPTTGDNCGVASVTNDAPVQFPKGVTTVTWTVTDTSGNTATCTQSVTVNDTENPTITCPDDITQDNDVSQCNASVTVPAPITGDNCGVASVVNDYNGTDDASDTYPVGVTTVTWTVTDTSGNTATCTQDVTVNDTEAPVIDITSAMQGSQELLGTSAIAVQGSVVITVTASDNCPLSGVPSVTVTPEGGSPATLTASGSGPWTYTYTVDATTPNGTATISASVTDDSANPASDADTFEINKNQITGQVELQGFVGASRAVTFAATGGTPKSWTLTLSFSGAVASYALTEVPDGTTQLSAKTEWSLRRKLTAGLDGNGQAAADFTTDTGKLLGGDINGSNSINILDYGVMKINWFTSNAVADITGDGQVNIGDYSIMKSNWFLNGDAE